MNCAGRRNGWVYDLEWVGNEWEGSSRWVCGWKRDPGNGLQKRWIIEN